MPTGQSALGQMRVGLRRAVTCVAAPRGSRAARPTAAPADGLPHRQTCAMGCSLRGRLDGVEGACRTRRATSTPRQCRRVRQGRLRVAGCVPAPHLSRVWRHCLDVTKDPANCGTVAEVFGTQQCLTVLARSSSVSCGTPLRLKDLQSGPRSTEQIFINNNLWGQAMALFNAAAHVPNCDLVGWGTPGNGRTPGQGQSYQLCRLALGLEARRTGLPSSFLPASHHLRRDFKVTQTAR